VRAVVIYDDGTKDCTACDRRLPLAHFHRDGNATGGYRSQCKECRGKKVQDWYFANHDVQVARHRAGYAANIAAIRERDAARYERDKEKRIQIAVDQAHRRRGRLRDAERSDRGINYDKLRERDGSCCYLCGSEMSFEVLTKGEYNPRRATIEHLTPISHGGLHVWENVALTCWECNLRRPRKRSA
jgi:5-methylcytosine-specific restriction endonuclease McrA